MSGRIVMLKASEATNDALNEWAQAAGFDTVTKYDGKSQSADGMDFHITLIASKNEIDNNELPPGLYPCETMTIVPEKFDVIGANNEVPIIRVRPDAALQAWRSRFEGVWGFRPTFAEFRPHISLSYKWSGTPNLRWLEMPLFPLVFDRLEIEEFEVKPGPMNEAVMSFGEFLVESGLELDINTEEQLSYFAQVNGVEFEYVFDRYVNTDLWQFEFRQIAFNDDDEPEERLDDVGNMGTGAISVLKLAGEAIKSLVGRRQPTGLVFTAQGKKVAVYNAMTKRLSGCGQVIKTSSGAVETTMVVFKPDYLISVLKVDGPSRRTFWSSHLKAFWVQNGGRL